MFLIYNLRGKEMRIVKKEELRAQRQRIKKSNGRRKEKARNVETHEFRRLFVTNSNTGFYSVFDCIDKAERSKLMHTQNATIRKVEQKQKQRQETQAGTFSGLKVRVRSGRKLDKDRRLDKHCEATNNSKTCHIFS